MTELHRIKLDEALKALKFAVVLESAPVEWSTAGQSDE